MLATQQDIEVVADVANLEDLFRACNEKSPDVVVVCVEKGGCNGAEAARQTVAISPRVKVIVLSAYVDRHNVTEVLSAGALGYLYKDCFVDELVKAIRTVSSGKTYLSAGAADVVVQGYFHHLAEATSSPSSVLTVREMEVLQLLAGGLFAREIAKKLVISVKTVETHRNHLMGKLDIKTSAGLVKYAIRKGLTPLEG